MSRIGKKPIPIIEGVTVNIKDGLVLVKGPKGELILKIHPLVSVKQEDNSLILNVKNPEIKKQGALWGLFRNLVNNMIQGVVSGFSKQLEISGIGFKAHTEGKTLILNVGFSHPIKYEIPDGIEIKVDKNIIAISGIDRQQVGQVAAEIRAIKKVEPYKGKGIKYIDEFVRRKVGKQATKTE